MGNEDKIVFGVVSIVINSIFSILITMSYVVNYPIDIVVMMLLIAIALNPPYDYTKMIIGPLSAPIVICSIVRIFVNFIALLFVIYLWIASLVNFAFEKNQLKTAIPMILQFCWHLIITVVFTVEVIVIVYMYYFFDEFISYKNGKIIMSIYSIKIFVLMVYYILTHIGMIIRLGMTGTGRIVLSFIFITVLWGSIKKVYNTIKGVSNPSEDI